MKWMILLFVTYAIAPIVAGHGILPMGFFTLFPIWQMALPVSAASVVAIGGLGTAAESTARLLSQLGGTTLLYGAWVINVHNAEQFNTAAERQMALESMILFSLPFQITAIGVLYGVARQYKHRRAKREHRTR